MAEVALPRPAPLAAAESATPLRRERVEKWLASAVALVVIAVVMSPVVQNWQARPRDNFPLSYFPMFSYGFDELQTEHYLVGLDAAGGRYPIHYDLIAPGGSLVRIRRETVREMAKRGQAALLCQGVSRRIADRNPRSLRSVVSLQVNTGVFSLPEYLRGNKLPKSEQVLATCSVQRTRA